MFRRYSSYEQKHNKLNAQNEFDQVKIQSYILETLTLIFAAVKPDCFVAVKLQLLFFFTLCLDELCLPPASVRASCITSLHFLFSSGADEFKGHSLLQAAREADMTKVKKSLALEIINFKHPQTHETALVSPSSLTFESLLLKNQVENRY